MKTIKKVLYITSWLVLGAALYGMGIKFIEHSVLRDLNDHAQNVFGAVCLGLSSISFAKAFHNDEKD